MLQSEPNESSKTFCLTTLNSMEEAGEVVSCRSRIAVKPRPSPHLPLLPRYWDRWRPGHPNTGLPLPSWGRRRTSQATRHDPPPLPGTHSPRRGGDAPQPIPHLLPLRQLILSPCGSAIWSVEYETASQLSILQAINLLLLLATFERQLQQLLPQPIVVDVTRPTWLLLVRKRRHHLPCLYILAISTFTIITPNFLKGSVSRDWHGLYGWIEP